MQISGLNISGGLQLWPNDPYFPDPYFEYTTLLLPGNGTNNGTNNTFIDGSTNNFTITRNGNTTQGTFSPFSLTGWSNYFDGTGDYLESPDNAAVELGSGDFTIETWFYTTNLTNAGTILARWDTSNLSYIFQILSSGTAIRFAYSTDGLTSTIRDYSATINTNQWYHVAVCRSSGSTKAFLNGTQIGTTTSDNVTIFNGTATVMIGKNHTAATSLFNGYLSNLRLVKSALYTSNFTPSTAPLTAIANTSLLTCQSNRFIDNSTNNFTITRSGDVSVQSFSPFNPTSIYNSNTNGGSGYFDGTGDYLNAPDSNLYDFGTSDFTIEAWIYPTTTSGTRILIGHYVNASADGFSLELNTSNNLLIWLEGSVRVTSTGTVKAYAWNHVVACRSGSTLRLFINGTVDGSVSNTTNISGSTSNLYISSSATTPGAGVFTGYMSGIRIVSGSAVYTTNFTPPTSPLTAITNTAFLCNFTNGQITDATSKNILETVGDAKISTTQSKFGGSSIYFDGTNDRLVMPISPNLDFGTGDFTIELWVNFSALSTSRIILDKWVTGDATGWQLYWRAAGTSITYYANSTVLLQDPSTSRITTNTWYHIAVTRSGSTNRLFIDGIEVASATNSTSLTNTNRLCIGEQLSTATNDLNGYINDLRITKGYARYTTNFTPPTQAFPLF